MAKPLLEKLTEAELKTWIPASRAIKQAEQALGDFKVAATTLVGNLKIGAIRSGAKFSGMDGGGKLTGAVEISPQHWEPMIFPEKESGLWRANQLVVVFPGRRDVMGNAMTDGEVLRYQGVALEPTALAEFLGNDAEAEVPNSEREVSGAREDRRTRVSDSALAAWASLFKKLYPDADQDFAWKSAQGFFPDKQVSRDRVRALVPRPQGRPRER